MKLHNRALYCTLTILFSAFFATSSFAQEGYEHLSPLAHGAGRSYSVTSRGLDAVGLNPALLGLGDSKRFQISVFPVSAFGLDAGPSFRDVNALSTVFESDQSFGSDSARDRILDLISNHKLSGRGDAEIFGLHYFAPNLGGIALTWTSHAGIRGDFPQEFIDFFSNGNQAISNLLTKTLEANSFDLQGFWYNEFGASYGVGLIKDSTGFLHDLTVGGAIKYVVGIGYMGMDPDNYLRIRPLNNAVEFATNYTMRFAYPDEFDPKKVPNRFSFDILSSQSAGTGIGFDLGATVGIGNSSSGASPLRLSVSATDIGSITWDKNTQIRHADSVQLIIKNEGATVQEIIDSLSPLAGKLEDTKSFSTSLPSVLRLGAMVDLAGLGINPLGTSFIGTIEYSMGLTDVVGSPKKDRIGVGFLIDRPSDIVGFSTGIGFALNNDGKGDITLGASANFFKHVILELGTAQLMGLLGSNDGNTDLAFALRLQF